MKKFAAFFVFSVLTLFAQPEQLVSFDEIYQTLVTGGNVNIVIKYSETKLMVDGEDEKAPEAVGGMELHPYEYFAAGSVGNEKAFISTSETVLISHPFYGYVLNYIKLRIYEDDSVEITARYLDPKNYEVKMDETFMGVINNNDNKGGIYFYKN